MMQIVDVTLAPLAVPLLEPFVIAQARMERTAAVLVEVRVDVDGRVGVGYGEAATLWPVTAIDAAQAWAELERARGALRGTGLAGHAGVAAALDAVDVDPVCRAGIESALLFAWADALGCPMHALIGVDVDAAPVGGAFCVDTDITLGIAAPDVMAAGAARWFASGMRVFKVKVGRADALGGLDADCAALRAIAARVPGARVRLDGNCGVDVLGAVRLVGAAQDAGLDVELFEQPTAAGDDRALAAVCGAIDVDVICDEDVKGVVDVDRVAALGAAGVNLKLVKHGGPVGAARVGRRALRRGLRLMAGAMVETRVGLSAMLHVVRALAGGARAPIAVDLDTALLLRGDPFMLGYECTTPSLTLLDLGPRPSGGGTATGFRSSVAP